MKLGLRKLPQDGMGILIEIRDEDEGECNSNTQKQKDGYGERVKGVSMIASTSHQRTMPRVSLC